MVFVGILFVIFIALAFSAVLAPPSLLRYVNAAGILAIAAVGTVPFSRASGFPPFSQAIFFGSSAIVTAWLATDHDWLPIATLLIVLVLGAALAYAQTALVKRVQGWRLAGGLLAIAAIVAVIAHLAMARGVEAWIRNVPAIESFGIDFRSEHSYMAVIWIVLSALVWLVTNVFDSFLGRSIVVSDMDARLARTFGVDRLQMTWRFVLLSCLPASFAGWLFVFWQRELGSAVFGLPLMLSIALCSAAAMILGAWGAVLGACVLTAMGFGLVKLPYENAWTSQVFALLLSAATVAALWKFFPVINAHFRKLRRRLDPHEVDLGAVDERSGMKGEGVPAPGTELVRLVGASVAESGAPILIKNLDFDIQAGESAGMICDTPQSREALVRLLTGGVQPSAGEVLVWGQSGVDIATHDWVRHGVSRTHQPARMIEDFHIIDNVTVGATARVGVGIPASMIRINAPAERMLRSEAMFHLARVWMREEAGAKPSELSVSRLQLVEVARALTADPALLVLDHPSASLQPMERATMITLINDLVDSGLAVVVVDRDIGFLREATRRLVVIESGEKTHDGPMERVLAQPGVRLKVESIR